eukprot:11314325-Ditylum_brightwellii.AAC.1
MIKEGDCDMHAMSNFKDLSISLSNENIQSIIVNTSDEDSDNNSCKLLYPGPTTQPSPLGPTY